MKNGTMDHVVIALVRMVVERFVENISVHSAMILCMCRINVVRYVKVKKITSRKEGIHFMQYLD